MSDEKFEVGDTVEWGGCVGTVSNMMKDNSGRICVDFAYMNWIETFEQDGRQHCWHKTPSLKLIAKKKKPFKMSKLISNAEIESMLNAFPKNSRIAKTVHRLRSAEDALRFYAEGRHFTQGHINEWITSLEEGEIARAYFDSIEAVKGEG